MSESSCPSSALKSSRRSNVGSAPRWMRKLAINVKTRTSSRLSAASSTVASNWESCTFSARIAAYSARLVGKYPRAAPLCAPPPAGRQHRGELPLRGQDRGVQRSLGGEVLEEHRLADAGGPRDPRGGGAVEPLRGEQRGRGRNDAPLPLPPG